MSSTAGDSQHGTGVIDVTDLHFRYAQRDVVNLQRLTLNGGESMAVLGPSGCGKTTLLHLLAGLLTPTAGTINILGQNIAQMSESQLDRYRGRHIGMVFQRLFLMPALTVRQNIQLARKLARVPQDSADIETLLAQLSIAELMHRKPNQLSLGQAQRVAIARALIHSPALVLADEPTSALDDEHAHQALQLLRDCAQSAGAALVVVTHDQRVRGQLDHELEMGMPL